MALAHGASLGTGNASASSVSLTTTPTVPSGAKLVLSASGYKFGGGTLDPTVTAAGGLTWTRRQFAQPNTDTNYWVAIWTADAPSGLASGTTLTVDAGVLTAGFTIGGAYLSGADVEATSTDTSGNAPGSGTGNRTVSVSLTTSNANDYIYYHASSDFGSGDAWTPNTNYTAIATFGQVSDDFGSNNGYRIVAASGAQTPGSTKTGTGGPAFGAAVAIKAAAGGTQVQAARSLSYDVSNTVQASRALSYGVQAQVTAARGLNYDVLAAVLASRALSYDVANTVQASRALAYDLIAFLAVARGLSYDIAAGVAPSNTVAPAITDDGTPQVGETVSCDTGTWTGDPTITYTYQWVNETLGDISGATSSSYTLQAGDEGFNLFCRVTATNGVGSNSADSNTIAVTAGSGTPVQASRALSYDVLNSVQASRALSYDLLNAVQASRALNYDVLASVLASRALSYDVANTLQVQRVLNYDVLNAVQASRALRYDVLAQVQASRALSYDLFNTVQAPRALSYDLGNVVVAPSSTRAALWYW